MKPASALRGAALAAMRSRASGPFLAALERVAPAGDDLLAVLTYHRVDEPRRDPALHPGLVSATPAEFEAQLGVVASRFRVLSLDELLAVRRKEARLPPRALLITFDDAYRDFAEHAWPALRRAGLPATLFVPTAYPDDPARSFWWDRLHGALAASEAPSVTTALGTFALATASERATSFRRLRERIKDEPHERAMAIAAGLAADLGAPAGANPVLGWDELRRLAREGVTLAPHGRTHAMLDRLPAAELTDEIAGSVADLQREFGPAPRAFAYPSGRYDERVVAAVADAGFELAFTTERGLNDLGAPDWLALRRINVGRGGGLGLVRVQLLPWFRSGLKGAPAAAD